MNSPAGRILITGGLGYVGGRLASYLAEAAPHLQLRLLTSRGPDRWPHWARRFDVVQGSVLDDAALAAALADVDTVIHLASVNEIVSAQEPDLALEVNGRGTHRVLKSGLAQGMKLFLYFSTFHIYGLNATGTINESTAPRPVAPYAFTHQLAEGYVNWFWSAYGLPSIILRLSNTCGSPMDSAVDRWTLVCNNLCRQAVQDGRLVLKSSGRQQRDFVSMTDVSRAVWHCLQLPPERWRGEIYNLGAGASGTVLELAHAIAACYAQRYGRSLSVETRGDDSTEYPRFTYDVGKLAGTGFDLLNNLEEEILATFTLCEQMRDAG